MGSDVPQGHSGLLTRVAQKTHREGADVLDAPAVIFDGLFQLFVFFGDPHQL
jgi:hypothetical protein